jgi:hypothetical protein
MLTRVFTLYLKSNFLLTYFIGECENLACKNKLALSFTDFSSLLFFMEKPVADMISLHKKKTTAAFSIALWWLLETVE